MDKLRDSTAEETPVSPEPTHGDESSRGAEVNDESLMQRLALTPTGLEEFTGVPPRSFDQRVFGGHLLAQALLAAAHTTGADRVANSLHGFFLRPGVPDREIRYTVSALHDGRSFCSRSVRAEQAGRILLAVDASFATARDGVTDAHALPMPDVPAPETLAPLHERTEAHGHAPDGFNWRSRRDWWTSSRPLDVRYVDQHHLDDPRVRCFWFRAAPALRADQNTQRAILAFASDRSLLPVIHQSRGELDRRGHRSVASVDHAMWFHSDVTAGDWLLYVQDSPYNTAGMGLARGLVYRADGALAATVTQQGVVPGSRPGQQP
ncbi:acyl-CoA thioesterase [Streptomyces fractus]|uniref:acyl-CoA thioesterase n=1 Tax=Streptomyces fractus TaxID=641806 RepID=UPI003CEA3300